MPGAPEGTFMNLRRLVLMLPLMVGLALTVAACDGNSTPTGISAGGPTASLAATRATANLPAPTRAVDVSQPTATAPAVSTTPTAAERGADRDSDAGKRRNPPSPAKTCGVR